VLIEADRLGSARGEHVERRVRRGCSAARLRLERVGATRPYQFGSNEVLYVERWKALSNLPWRLPLIADEFEHITISVFHEKTVPEGRLQTLSKTRLLPGQESSNELPAALGSVRQSPRHVPRRPVDAQRANGIPAHRVAPREASSSGSSCG